ncbi:hypothetical protein [Flavobacterium cerinum]|uniref:Uncharacterized protein n=1 Tax=Flavobacterium cerinum TaxID=2502784 RepID=A0A3S3QSR8_9FLAO|nr:hypothetical protein [Flavobacterium cerinum]RWX00933.1 hypothetical protein EPI11_07885 [Flavobacterium cerinum]
MKKLLLTALLFTTLLQAQDKAFIDGLSKMDFDQAKSFANEIVASSRTKWVPLYDKENDKSAAIWFVDASLSPERIDKIKSGKSVCETGECLKVAFTAFYEGENKNLEVKGTKKYKFNSVVMKYLDIFPVWQKYFQPTADVSSLPDNYKLQDYKQGNTLYKFKQENTPYWSLTKFY